MSPHRGRSPDRGRRHCNSAAWCRRGWRCRRRSRWSPADTCPGRCRSGRSHSYCRYRRSLPLTQSGVLPRHAWQAASARTALRRTVPRDAVPPGTDALWALLGVAGFIGVLEGCLLSLVVVLVVVLVVALLAVALRACAAAPDRAGARPRPAPSSPRSPARLPGAAPAAGSRAGGECRSGRSRGPEYRSGIHPWQTSVLTPVWLMAGGHAHPGPRHSPLRPEAPGPPSRRRRSERLRAGWVTV